MTETILLAIIAAVLVWRLVLEAPVVLAVRAWRQRRRVVSGALEAAPPPAPPAAPTSVQLLLCSASGRIEHEVALHLTGDLGLPESFVYAGKTYTAHKRVMSHHSHDVVWEYRR